MKKRAKEALALAKRAAIHFYNTDPEFVIGGCSDMSEVIGEFLKRHGYPGVPTYGAARYGKGDWFMHAWLDIDGTIFDPALWAQGRNMKKYSYQVDAEVADALLCDVEYILDGSVEELEKELLK